MASVQQQVESTDDVISQCIRSLDDDRGFLSQTILAQLNLVEGSTPGHASTTRKPKSTTTRWGPALDAVKAKANVRLPKRCHNVLQAGTSLYTLDAYPVRSAEAQVLRGTAPPA